MYLIPQLKLNLISCSRLDDYSISINFKKGSCVLSYRRLDNKVFETLRRRDTDGLFTAKIKKKKCSNKANITRNTVLHKENGTQDIESADTL